MMLTTATAEDYLNKKKKLLLKTNYIHDNTTIYVVICTLFIA